MRNLPSIAIDGSGVAASCCAKLLQAKGFDIQFENVLQNGPSPTLLLNTSTQQLLKDIFGSTDLFAGLPAIFKRTVKWGNQPAVTFPHAGLVVKECVLLDRLRRLIHNETKSPSTEVRLKLFSKSRVDHGVQHHFGSRLASATQVRVRSTARCTCWIESLDEGWLFLLPDGEESASLISVGDIPAKLLIESQLIAAQIDDLGEELGRYPAHPRILDPLCAPFWLACGSAAMSFDPICGEGAGNAAREAILAAAVIKTMAGENESRDALTHYSSRLLAGFERHLTNCRQFYATAGTSEWWQAELAALNAGLGWTRSRLARLPIPRYRLTGFELERIH